MIRRLPTLISLVTLTLLAPAIAHAACVEDAFVDSGWTGTIGTVPVSLVLRAKEAPGGSALVGRYYYRRSLQELYLRAEAATPTRWSETDAAGRRTGTLEMACSGDTLTGTWRSLDGRRSLPISARKAPPDVDHDTVRTRDLKPDRATTQAFESRFFDAIEHSAITGVATVSLWGDGPGITRINQGLWQQARDHMAEALSCKGEGRMERGVKHGYEYGWSQQVAAWNDRYVVITTGYGGYCGGAHPYSGTDASVFDTGTGVEVAPATWLLPTYRESIDLQTPLGRLLIGRYLSKEDGETECLDKVAANGHRMHPVREGLVFEVAATAYVYTPCTRDVTVPWSQVMPFLGAEGRAAAAAFR